MGGESPPQTRPSHVPHPRHTSEAGGMAASKVIIRRSGYVCCIETNSSSPLKKGQANINHSLPGASRRPKRDRAMSHILATPAKQGAWLHRKLSFGEADMFVASKQILPRL